MSPDKNGWIKIKGKEDLPESGQLCFVWFKNNVGIETWCYTIYLDDGFDGIANVTHWRPVFEPPVKRRK